MAGQLQKCPGRSCTLLGELHLEFTHGEHWRSLSSLCARMLTRLQMRNCMMSTWTTYRSLYTHSYTYIHKYNNFLVWVISVGLASARPNKTKLQGHSWISKYHLNPSRETWALARSLTDMIEYELARNMAMGMACAAMSMCTWQKNGVVQWT